MIQFTRAHRYILPLFAIISVSFILVIQIYCFNFPPGGPERWKYDGHKRKRRDDSDCARKHRENSQNRDGSQDRESDSNYEQVSKLFGPWDIAIDFKNKNYCPCCVCQGVVRVIRYLYDLVHQQGSSSSLLTDIRFLWLLSYHFLSF